jgi:protein phosphatase
MKALIISDLHANFAALSALPESFDELWVIGDLVNYGPQPREVVNFVRQHATVVVQGNHDHAVGCDTDPRCTPRYASMASTTQQFTASQLNDEERKFLAGLPQALEFQRDGKRVFTCHAKPSDPLYGYCPADSDQWANEVQRVFADVLIVGHTHTPFVREEGGTLVVNPGSLGQPKTGRSDACYAVWQDGEIELKQFPYPVQETAARIDAMPWPAEIRRDLITVLRTGSVS